jgi:hypothetical protein
VSEHFEKYLRTYICLVDLKDIVGSGWLRFVAQLKSRDRPCAASYILHDRGPLRKDAEEVCLPESSLDDTQVDGVVELKPTLPPGYEAALAWQRTIAMPLPKGMK